MASRNIFIFLLTFLNFAPTFPAQFVPLPFGSLPGPGSPNPGIKVQITRKGLDYFRDFTVQSLNHNLRKLRIKKWTVDAATLGIPGNDLAVLKNVVVTSYRPAARVVLQPSRPNKMFWVISGIGMGCSGKFDLFDAQSPDDLSINASFQASLDGLDLQIVVSIHRSDKNTIKMLVDQCRADITGPVQVRLHDRDPAVTETLEILTPIIEGEFRNVFAREICALGSNFVEHELNNLFAEYTSNLSFGKGLKFTPGQTRFLAFLFPWQEINNFAIDTNLIANPSVTQQNLETRHNGRIYHKFDRPEFHPLNFRPKIMPQIPFQSTKMLQVQISDYALNSFMNAAHGHNLLAADITPKTHPNLLEFLKLRCRRRNQICIGQILPELTRLYSSTRAVEISVRTSIPPRFEFQPDGFVAFVLQGTVVMKVPRGRPRLQLKERIVEANAAVGCRASVAYVRQRMRGKVRIDSIDLEITKSTTQITEQAKYELSELAKSVFEEIINEDLANGIPMPLLNQITLHNSDIQVGENAMLFGTDFSLDEATARNLVASAIARHFSESP